MIKNFHKQVYTFKIHKLIISDVNTHGEEEACISPVYYLVCPELWDMHISTIKKDQDQTEQMIAKDPRLRISSLLCYRYCHLSELWLYKSLQSSGCIPRLLLL